MSLHCIKRYDGGLAILSDGGESFFSTGNYPFDGAGCVTSQHTHPLLQINEQDMVTRRNQAEDLCAPSSTILFL